MKSTSQYQAEKLILDQALASGGGKMSFETPGQAIHFRQKVYTFRKIMRDNMAPMNSPYDRLTLPQLASGALEVEIKVHAVKGVFTPNDGQSLVPPEPEDDDDLLAEARRIASNIL